MSSTFFTTDDGDIVLRAGPDPDSKHDFRVHKFILSLASPVFKDMFAFPQPSDQNQSEGHQPPVVDVLEPPQVIDTILRLIYPGVEPPKIADFPALTALLSAADKYNITSIYPVLRGTLKTFLRDRFSFRVYVVACRFGFPEEAKEAARVGNTDSITIESLDEEVQHISSVDVVQWVKFTQERESEGRSKIKNLLDWQDLDDEASCEHGVAGKDFYFRLEKAVEEAFLDNPCVGRNDLFAVLDKVPDPPPGCDQSSYSESGEYYCEIDALDAFKCPLRPMSIRSNLATIADELNQINRAMLDEAFGKGG